MTETRLLARLLATARTVGAPSPITPARAIAGSADPAETVQVKVLARLADGTFRVLVDGAAQRLELPAHVKPGDTLELRMLPRQEQAAAPATPRGAAGTLSATGRLISTLLAQAPGAPPPQARPVLEAAPISASAMPAALARALERSGIFYESHQARWIEGDYPLERLLQEPQAVLAAARHGAADVAAAPAPEAQKLVLQGDAQGPDRGDGTTETQRMADARPHERALELPSRDGLALVRNQLEALDARHVVWLGEVWPGQPLRWEIEAGEDDGERHAGDDERVWNTRLSLALPALGEVTAKFALSEGLRLELAAAAPEAAARMRAALPELAQALAGAGIGPIRLDVRADEPAA